MLETLGELPLALRLLIAFAVVLVLMAITFWLLRRFAGTRLGTVGRGRQPRLAVIDAAAVDGRRRLVLIRRDNVEHLLLIGGPADVVVEQNIVRAVPVAPPREIPARGPAAETPARAEPLARVEPPPRPQPPARPEAPVHPPETIPAAPPAARVREPQPRPERAPRPEPRPPLWPEARAAAPRRETPEMPLDQPEAPVRSPRPAERMAPPRRQAEPATEARATFAAPGDIKPVSPSIDANMSELTQRLDAALRRPGVVRPRPPAARPPVSEAPAPSTPAPATPAAPAAAAPPPEPKPEARAPVSGSAEAAPAAKPSDGGPAPQPSQPPAPAKSEKAEGSKRATGKTVFDSLEEEMASLLGRPADKP